MEHQTHAAGGVVQITHPGIGIEKRLLKIVPAWTLGPDDFLRIALPGITDPVVPSDEVDPPFHRSPTGRPVVYDDGD